MCGYDRNSATPSEIIEPHDGVSRWTLSRGNDACLPRIAAGKPSVVATMMIGSVRQQCRVMIRPLVAPMQRAASTNLVAQREICPEP